MIPQLLQGLWQNKIKERFYLYQHKQSKDVCEQLTALNSTNVP